MSIKNPTSRVDGKLCGEDDCMVMQKTQDKGWGLFATKLLKPGTTILIEDALVFVPMVILPIGDWANMMPDPRCAP